MLDKTQRNEAWLERIQVQQNPDVVVQPMGSTSILLNTKTDRFYEINRTTSVFWELLARESTIPSIRAQMLSLFDVNTTTLNAEIINILSLLENEGLVAINE